MSARSQRQPAIGKARARGGSWVEQRKCRRMKSGPGPGVEGRGCHPLVPRSKRNPEFRNPKVPVCSRTEAYSSLH